MPYKLRKARNRDLYWVVGIDGTKHSKEPIPKKRAEAQMKALYVAMRTEKKGGVSIPNAEFVKEHKELLEVLKDPKKRLLHDEYLKQKKELDNFLRDLRNMKGGKKEVVQKGCDMIEDIINGKMKLVGGSSESARQKYERILKEDADSWNKYIPDIITVSNGIAYVCILLGEEFPALEAFGLLLRYMTAQASAVYDVYGATSALILTVKSIQILETGTNDDKDIAVVLVSGLPAKVVSLINAIMKLLHLRSDEFRAYTLTPGKKVQVGPEDDWGRLFELPNQGEAPKAPSPLTFPDLKGLYETVRGWVGKIGAELPPFDKMVSSLDPNPYTHPEDTSTAQARTEWDRLWAEENTIYAVPSNSLDMGVYLRISNLGSYQISTNYERVNMFLYAYPDNSLHKQYWNNTTNCPKEEYFEITNVVEAPDGWKSPPSLWTYNVKNYWWKSPLGTGDGNTFKLKWLNDKGDELVESNFRAGENYVKPSVMKRAEEDWDIYSKYWKERDSIKIGGFIWVGGNPIHYGMPIAQTAPPGFLFPSPDSITKDRFLEVYTNAWEYRQNVLDDALLRVGEMEIIQQNYAIERDAYDKVSGQIYESPYDPRNKEGRIFDSKEDEIIWDIFDSLPTQYWRDIAESQGEYGDYHDEKTFYKYYKLVLLFYLFPRAIIQKQIAKEAITRANEKDPSGDFMAPIAIDAADLEFIFGGLRTPPIPEYAPRNPGNSLWLRATDDALFRLYKFINHQPDVAPRPPIFEKYHPNGDPALRPDMTDRWLREERQERYEKYLFSLDTNNLEDIARYNLESFIGKTDWKNAVLINTPSRYPENPKTYIDFLPVAVEEWMELYPTPPYNSYNNAQREEWIYQEAQRLFDAK